jgi:pimeloyl-ACP methyl ester carboxylesterase
LTDRAIILVPGFEKREQLEARDMLVQSLDAYAEGYHIHTSDAKEDEGFNSIEVTATSRTTQEAITLKVYEAYWGDLVPDWSGESPWARFKRGMSLVFYWFLGGLAKSTARREWPVRTLVAITVAGLMMLLWYLVVIALLVKAYAESAVQVPAAVESFFRAIGLYDPLATIIQHINAAPVVIFLVGLAGLGILERTANLSAFAKAYLQDTSFGGGVTGLRSKARARVRAVLDHVHARAFDEVYVVAHSFGGPIAIDALAEYGTPLEKTVLHTWGSAMGVLAQQEPLMEKEIGKFYTAGPQIANWIDVVFPKDMMGSKVPVPFQYDGARKGARFPRLFPDTITPQLPAGVGFRFAEIHDAYYKCETAVQMLVKPRDELPPKVAQERPEKPVAAPADVTPADTSQPAERKVLHVGDRRT